VPPMILIKRVYGISSVAAVQRYESKKIEGILRTKPRTTFHYRYQLRVRFISLVEISINNYVFRTRLAVSGYFRGRPRLRFGGASGSVVPLAPANSFAS
jgi:hypothetical protein